MGHWIYNNKKEKIDSLPSKNGIFLSIKWTYLYEKQYPFPMCEVVFPVTFVETQIEMPKGQFLIEI